MKRKTIFFFLALLIILGLGVAGYFYLRIYGPNVTPGGNEDTRYLYIPTGATFENVKDSLTHQGILKNINSFNWVAGMMEYRSEEHTSELQSLMRISYAVYFLKQKKNNTNS